MSPNLPKLSIALLALAQFSLVACKKHVTGSAGQTSALGPNVFIAGSVNGRAVYWNNGVIHYLTDTTIQQWSFSRQIVFSGNDTFICGSEELFSTTPNAVLPVYWKNGIMTHLPGGPQGQASSISLSGSDIVIYGALFNYNSNDPIASVYWKNGVLDTWSFGGAGVGQVITSGTDTLAAGVQTIGDSTFATYWKDGVATLLTKDSASYTAGIGFSGNDLYIAGVVNIYSPTDRKAVYWKNGIPTFLGPAYDVQGMAIANGDIYVAGTMSSDGDHLAGICYKNGAILTQLPEGTQVFSVYLSGSDVYLTGEQTDLQTPGALPHAMVWKNGVPTDLGANNFAYSLTVK